MIRALALGLLALVLWTQSFIDLELALDLGPWHMNAPVADLAALTLLPLGLWLRRQAPVPAPGWPGYLLFLLAGLLSARHAIDPHASLHHLLRKPIFLFLAYGCAIPVVVRLAPPRMLAAGLLGGAALTSLVSLGSSALRIAAGDALWFQALAGLTPNHKTLAVALAGQLPLLLGLPRLLELGPRAELARRLTLALVLAALLGSASKTAWITAAFGVAWFLPQPRPLATRPRLLAPLVALGLGLALYAPLLTKSRAMLDAARSRHSLNVRAWEMFERHPLTGSGSGMNVVEEMVTFPHYRVNGVDAHGVLQKVASETGLVGLLGYLGFVVLMARPLVARSRAEGTGGPAWVLLACFAALHLNLLLSTETLSPTHWAPLALLWGLLWRASSPGARA